MHTWCASWPVPFGQEKGGGLVGSGEALNYRERRRLTASSTTPRRVPSAATIFLSPEKGLLGFAKCCIEGSAACSKNPFYEGQITWPHRREHQVAATPGWVTVPLSLQKPRPAVLRRLSVAHQNEVSLEGAVGLKCLPWKGAEPLRVPAHRPAVYAVPAHPCCC